jgi:hypothetical protein
VQGVDISVLNVLVKAENAKPVIAMRHGFKLFQYQAKTKPKTGK